MPQKQLRFQTLKRKSVSSSSSWGWIGTPITSGWSGCAMANRHNRPKGLGLLTLGMLIAELCDWSRFKNRKQISSYTGLCGGVSSSGQSHCDLSITKAGNARVRWLLVELAWRMVLYQPQCRAVQRWRHVLLNPQAALRQRKRALIALARQLAVDIWRWQTGKVTPQQLGWVMV